MSTPSQRRLKIGKKNQKKEVRKYYTETVVREYFATPEERANAIKNHQNLNYDEKTQVLNGGIVGQVVQEDRVYVTLTTKEIQD